jgi:hypothetical protein
MAWSVVTLVHVFGVDEDEQAIDVDPKKIAGKDILGISLVPAYMSM